MIDRPSWDNYFLSLTFLIAQRSFDNSTKCGCVLVDEKNCILSTGYNGPIRGSNDETVPMTRPDKYFVMEHSERNAIYIAATNGIALKNSKAYVTGLPCIDCLRGLLQVGVTEIIYGQNAAVMTPVISKEHEMLLSNTSVKIREVKNEEFVYLFGKAEKYCLSKIPFVPMTFPT